MLEDQGTIILDSLNFDVQRFLKDFGAALNWLAEKCGRTPLAGRFSEYYQVLREKYLTSGQSDRPDLFKTITATTEAIELIDIWMMLHDYNISHLNEKLKKYAGGPAYEREENPSSASNAARNTGFELSMLARFLRCGFNAAVTEGADVVFDFEDAVVAVECKRPQNESKLPRAISDGLSQLKRRRDRLRGRKFIGILALGVGKSIHQGEMAIQALNREGFLRLCDKELLRIAKENERDWNKNKHARYSHIILLVLRVPVLDETGGAIREGTAIHIHRKIQSNREKHQRLLRLRERFQHLLREK